MNQAGKGENKEYRQSKEKVRLEDWMSVGNEF